MVPAIPCSFGNVTIFAVSSSPRKGTHSMKCMIDGRSLSPLLSHQRYISPQRYILPPSLPFKLIQKYRSDCGLRCRSRVQILASVGTNVATDDPNPAISDKGANETTDPAPASPFSNETSSSPRTTKRPRSVRKSEMPPVKNEELLPGASFTGKVRSIQPFGAFVDFGAFTDGLVHVSNLSNDFVKDVGTVVSVGQEVTVKILEANMETARISLTMRDSSDTNKSQQKKEGTDNVNNEKPKTPRRNAARSNQKREDKSSKFVKGQLLDATVKNLTRSGAFISLPEGEEGFLPSSEESEGFTVLGSSSLQVGQEVNVRVLRVTRGQVTLTMKKKEDLQELNMKLNQGVVHVATNPFELAFRRNKDIAAFLDEREKLNKYSEPLDVPATAEHNEALVPETTSHSDTATEDETASSEEQAEEKNVADPTSSELVTEEEKSESSLPSSSQNDEPGTETSIVDNGDLEAPVSQENGLAAKLVGDKSSQSDGEKGDGSMDVAMPEDDTSTGYEIVEKTVSATDSTTDESSVEDAIKETSSETDAIEKNDVNISSSSSDPSPEDSGDATPPLVCSEVTPATEDGTVAEQSNPEKDENAISNVQTTVGTQEISSKASISPALVKQLREETGAGMMDCKKALSEVGGDIIKAQEILRKKGLASADKRASRATAEGRIGSYIHDNRIGVLIEVNCETDFVARGDMFKELVDDLAMQIAACPQVRYLNPEDVPEEIVEKEREIEMQKEDILTKPEQIRSKIVDGRIKKRVEELALLEQPYIKNDKLAVKDLVKQTIATVGENIKVKRFIRFNLGEGLEKKSQDFAAEVAAQTAAKQAPTVQKDKPAETNETPAKSTVAVSAALVKQLREDTGAGMMDCKKALTETGGDLEKAQEYLRKKGLSSADKKSSRLAAEGCISSYIHDSRIGVLIEVNSETDFVGRNERFRELVDDLAMQVAACPQVDFVSVEDVPESIVSKEREMEMQREDLKSKPENIREKIVEGRISKRLGELALLEQPFIKDDRLLVKDLVKQTVAALGENIRARRFARFTLGESDS